MSASQDGSQVLGLPGGLPSSAFFAAMGVGGVGLVCGCCGAGAVLVGGGVERLHPGNATAAKRIKVIVCAIRAASDALWAQVNE